MGEHALRRRRNSCREDEETCDDFIINAKLSVARYTRDENKSKKKRYI